MSKMDALRAMREEGHEQAMARRAASANASPPAARPAPAPQRSTPAPARPSDEACGHRSMNGRTCTRESGHAAKSHRYT